MTEYCYFTHIPSTNSLIKGEIPTQKTSFTLPVAKVFPKYYRRNSMPVHVLEVSTNSGIPCNDRQFFTTAGALSCCSVQQYREFTQAGLSQEDSAAYALEEYWKTLSIGYFAVFLYSGFVIYKISSTLVCYSGNSLRGNEQEIWHFFQHHSL